MPTFELSQPNVFPPGTSVGAYTANKMQLGHAPVGAAVVTGTMGTYAVEFAGLEYDVDYVAYALVNGAHRYVAFRTEVYVQVYADINAENTFADDQTFAGDNTFLGENAFEAATFGGAVAMDAGATVAGGNLVVEGDEIRAGAQTAWLNAMLFRIDVGNNKVWNRALLIADLGDPPDLALRRAGPDGSHSDTWTDPAPVDSGFPIGDLYYEAWCAPASKTSGSTASGATSVVLGSTDGFRDAGTVLLGTDLITYTGTSGGTTLTGVTGVTQVWPSGTICSIRRGEVANTTTTAQFIAGTDTTITLTSVMNVPKKGYGLLEGSGGYTAVRWTGRTGSQLTGVTVVVEGSGLTHPIGTAFQTAQADWDGLSNQQGKPAEIHADTTELQTPWARGTKLVFETTPNGLMSSRTVLELGQDGELRAFYNARVDGELSLKGAASIIRITSLTDGGSTILQVRTATDTQDRFSISASGQMQGGSGSATPDVVLTVRNNAGQVLLSKGYLDMTDTANGFIRLPLRTTDPAAPASGMVLYCKAVAGKATAFARFPTGAVQPMATEP